MGLIGLLAVAVMLVGLAVGLVFWPLWFIYAWFTDDPAEPLTRR